MVDYEIHFVYTGNQLQAALPLSNIVIPNSIF